MVVSVYVTGQVPEVSEHWPFDGMKCPVVLVVESVTVPVGNEPFTVTVQLVKVPTSAVSGEHETLVVVAAKCFVTLNEKPPLAGVLYVSPGYEPVISAVALKIDVSV